MPANSTAMYPPPTTMTRSGKLLEIERFVRSDDVFTPRKFGHTRPAARGDQYSFGGDGAAAVDLRRCGDRATLRSR